MSSGTLDYAAQDCFAAIAVQDLVLKRIFKGTHAGFSITVRARFMWIVTNRALSRPYTFIVAVFIILLMTPIVLQRTPDRYVSQYRYSGHQPCLELHRIVSATDGTANRDGS